MNAVVKDRFGNAISPGDKVVFGVGHGCECSKQKGLWKESMQTRAPLKFSCPDTKVFSDFPVME